MPDRTSWRARPLSQLKQACQAESGAGPRQGSCHRVIPKLPKGAPSTTVRPSGASKCWPPSPPRAHRWVYRVSGGRLGHGVFGAPVLLLHTTGRRSGKRHSTPLVYGTDMGTLIVVASNRGGDQAPHWFRNLQANPDVELWIARHKAPPRQPSDHAARPDLCQSPAERAPASGRRA